MLYSSVLLFIPGNTFYQPDCILGDMDNIHSANGNVEPGDKHVTLAAVEAEVKNLNSDSRRLSPPSVAVEKPNETTANVATPNKVSPMPKPSPPPVPEKPEDRNNNNQTSSSPAHNNIIRASPAPSPPAPPTLPKVCIDYHYT